jgi:hypothetical protein
MVALILGMLICVVLALAIVALVAIPARRDGRDILTPKGDEVVTALKERQQSARQRHGRDDEDDAAAGDVDGPAAVDEPVVPADAGVRS